MSSYDFHFPYISVFFDLKSGSRFYKVEVKNILLVKKIEFDALYQDTLHPENLVIMTDRKKRTLAKIDDVPRVLDEITEAMKHGESVYVLPCEKK